jgi:hypothetical protein
MGRPCLIIDHRRPRPWLSRNAPGGKFAPPPLPAVLTPPIFLDKNIWTLEMDIGLSLCFTLALGGKGHEKVPAVSPVALEKGRAGLKLTGFPFRHK